MAVVPVASGLCSIDSGGVTVVRSTPVAVVPVAPVAVVRSTTVAIVRSTPVAVVPPVSSVAVCRSARGCSICRCQLRYLLLQWLHQYLSQSFGNCCCSCCCCCCCCCLRFYVSVDIDNYQKRSPVENVLESTENLCVIVSNRVHGKHSSRW